MTPLERRVRRIVRGQVRSYFNDHPESFQKWKSERHKNNEIEGITKRVAGDVLALLQGTVGQGGGETASRTARPAKAPSGVLDRAPEGHPNFFFRWLRYLQGWRPIDGAPKDGSSILVTRYPSTSHPPLNLVRWSAGKHKSFRWRHTGTYGRALRYEPSHYRMPPQPPGAA